MDVRRVTTTGHSRLAVISPDGRYVVHSVIINGQQSLWTRQVATSSDVQIIPPADVIYQGLSFSRDGNYVFYLVAQTLQAAYKTLYKIPVLGGMPRKIIADVDSPVAFSPDGSQIAYVRFTPDTGQTDLLINNPEGSAERTVVRKLPQSYGPIFRTSSVAWSPDGKMIVLAAPVPNSPERATLIGVAVDGGTERRLTARDWRRVGGAVWLNDGSGLVFEAQDVDSSSSFSSYQLWLLSYPSGDARRITNDLNSYSGVSLTADSNVISATQSETVSTLWATQPGTIERTQQISFGNKDEDGIDGIAWTPDGRLVFPSRRGGNRDMWVADADGANASQLTFNSGSNSYPAVSPDGRTIVFVSTRTGSSCLWKMDMTGANPMQLTRSSGDLRPVISPDGKVVMYYSRATAPPSVWKVPLGGGEPVQVASAVFAPTISPDGKSLAVMRNLVQFYVEIIPIAGGSPIKELEIPFSPYTASLPTWSHDGRGLIYIDNRSGIGNLWLQPITGGHPRPLTRFTSERLYSFAWSPDGKRFAAARGNTSYDTVLISNFR
jgi:Tol biopolymer transport system component